MNRRLALLATGGLISAAVTAAADVPALPHPVGPPAVYGLNPNSGSISGATPVEIFGNDFRGATSVKFGGKPAARFFVFSNRHILVRSPAMSGGPVDVTVTTPLGTSAITLADQFTYGTIGTVVDAVDPRQGTAAGGTGVVIQGHGLWGASSIQFGLVSIPCFLPPASATPAPSAGPNLPLALERVLATTGSQPQQPAGGGPGPGGGRCQRFGDDSHLIVLSPAGTANTTVDITVTNGGVTSAAGPGTKFTYVAPVVPVVNAVGPGHGSKNGGTNVAIFGSGFSGASLVNFGSGPSGLPVPPCPFGPFLTPSRQNTRSSGGPLPRGALGGGPGGPGPCFIVQNDTLINVPSPTAAAVGPVHVTVNSAAGGGQPNGQADVFTFDTPGPPEVDAVTPKHGSALGGGNVHIQGSGLTGASAVKFGAASVPPCGPTSFSACFFLFDDANANVTGAPAGTANTTVDVTVTVGPTTSSTSPADTFTFDAATAPLIQAIDPIHGPTRGGTNVTLLGKGFGAVTSMSFGGVAMTPCPTTPPGPCFGIGGDTSIFVSSPGTRPTGPGPWPVQVSVANAVGSSNGVTFTYDLPVPPAIYSVNPSTGPASGGTSVWVSGAGLSETGSVTFDTATASYQAGFNIPFGTDNVLQVFTPQVPSGTTLTDITTHRPSGPSAHTPGDQFTFSAVTPVTPTVAAVTPSQAPAGAPVAIYGSGFSMATTVSFGSTPAPGIYVANDHLIQTNAPPGPSGQVDVTVTTPSPGGTSATNPNDKFTYGATPAGPQVGGLDPSQATQYGGANLNIYGTGFNMVDSVSFGTTALSPCNFGPPGPCFNQFDLSHIYVSTPSGLPGTTVDVSVKAGGITSPTGAAKDKFTFMNPGAPVVDAVDPNQGSTFGSFSTIYGVNLAGATAVNVGNNTMGPCPPFGGGGPFGPCFTVAADNQIQIPIPPAGPGTVHVTVTRGLVTSASTSADQYTYVTPGAPTITGITPSSGPTSGGTVVYVSGTNLRGASVSFGPNPSFNILQFLSSATLLAVVSPPGIAGSVPLTVTTPSGTVSGQFTYAQSPAPSITALNPNHGSSEGGTQVFITGTDLGGANAVRFGSTNTFGFFNNFDFFTQSPGPMMVSSPPGAGGTTVDVSVTTPAGTSAPVAADLFTYDVAGAPVVNAISPNTGVTEGATEVLISGVNLASATKVSFGGISGFDVFPIAPGVLFSSSPPATVGTVDVIVTTPAGVSGTSANTKYTYVATPQPVVVAISPTHGPPGTNVLISGTNLSLNKPGDTVKFGSVVPYLFGQAGPGEIGAVSPPSAPGVVHITVTNDGGTSATSPADLYTFDPAQPPTVTVIAPDNGPAGTRVFITGTNLGGTTEVDFGSDLATSIYVASDTLVIATSPCDNGRVDVIVKTAAGTATSPNKFKHRRCHAEGEQQGNNNNRNENNAPPIPPGPPPNHPRGSAKPDGPATTMQSLPTQGAVTPADLTAPVSAIWLRLRAMSSLFGGP